MPPRRHLPAHGAVQRWNPRRTRARCRRAPESRERVDGTGHDGRFRDEEMARRQRHEQNHDQARERRNRQVERAKVKPRRSEYEHDRRRQLRLTLALFVLSAASPRPNRDTAAPVDQRRDRSRRASHRRRSGRGSLGASTPGTSTGRLSRSLKVGMTTRTTMRRTIYGAQVDSGCYSTPSIRYSTSAGTMMSGRSKCGT